MKYPRNLIIAAAAFPFGLIAAVLLLREPTEPLTREALADARQRWDRGGVHSYRARFRMHGGLYDVTVADDLVENITVNGRPANIAEIRAYSIPGLFDTLELELENIELAGDSGPKVMARVRFDRGLGYPQRYLRGGGPLGRGTTFEMLEFQAADEQSGQPR